MKNFAFVSIFSVFLILFGCKDNSSNNFLASENGTISGVVRDARTNLPIENALISTTPATSTLQTDKDGAFKLDIDSAGYYIIKAEKQGYYASTANIKVNLGKTTNVTILLTSGIDANRKPNIPGLISPSNGGNLNTTESLLKWSCSDPDGDKLTYDVYFGKTNPPVNKVSSDLKDTTYYIRDLSDSTDYYWKIVARDNYGATEESSVWTFSVKKDRPVDYDKTGLIAYYPFDGNAADKSGNNLNGRINGASLSADRYSKQNSAMSFNGYSNFVSVSKSPLLDLGGIFTIAMWIKPNPGYGQDHQGYIYLVSRWDATGPLASSYLLALTPNGKVCFFTYDNSNHDIMGYSTIAVNSWSHIAVTRTSNGEFKIYVNGMLDISSYLPMGQSSDYDLEIGRNRVGYSYYSGSMDDIFIYDRALSEQEIKKLAQN